MSWAIWTARNVLISVNIIKETFTKEIKLLTFRTKYSITDIFLLMDLEFDVIYILSSFTLIFCSLIANCNLVTLVLGNLFYL
jgi:hypothetical protein